MQLLYKTVNLSIAENKTIRRLQDISSSAINQQRQEAQKNQAEKVLMLGQMNREKPLDAITRETIQELRCAICIIFIF